MPETKELSASLYFKDSRSDKEYHLQLIAQGDGYMVTAQNGRRGGTLTPRNKTTVPVAYDKARAVYDKTLKEKLSEGYSTGVAGKGFVGSDKEDRVSGVKPQLLNPVNDEDHTSKLLDDPLWAAQEKFDGHRRLVQRDGAEVTGINRKGLTKALPAEIASVLLGLPTQQFVLDGELMGNTLVVFDILERAGVSLRSASCKARLLVLDEMKEELQAIGSTSVRVAATAYTRADKRQLYLDVKRARGEGIVFKLLDSKYVEGRPNKGGEQLKQPFVHRASFLVASVSDTKRSVGLSVLNEQGKPVAVGNCTIPANYPIPSQGAVVDVEYLYAFLGGSVFQPRYKGERDDVDESACTENQLRYKPSTTSDEEDAETPTELVAS